MKVKMIRMMRKRMMKMIMTKKKFSMQRMKNSMMLSMNKELWSEKNS
jgi:hypothetical protein